jgi:hypothetical protein
MLRNARALKQYGFDLNSSGRLPSEADKGADVTPLSDEVHDRPMSLPELDVFFSQRGQF